MIEEIDEIKSLLGIMSSTRTALEPQHSNNSSKPPSKENDEQKQPVIILKDEIVKEKKVHVKRNYTFIENAMKTLTSWFGFLMVFFALVTSVLLVFFMLQVDEQINPTIVEYNQSEEVNFTYLLTDSFLIANNSFSSTSTSEGLYFNSPFGLNFGNFFRISPNGTIFLQNPDFSEILLNSMKIKGSTISPLFPNFQQVVIDLTTAKMQLNVTAMSIECSGFTIKDQKLYDANMKELSWPEQGDSRYSSAFGQSDSTGNVLSEVNFNEKTITNTFKNEKQIPFLGKSQKRFENKNLYTNFTVIPHDENRKAFKCTNLTANYFSFACISHHNYIKGENSNIKGEKIHKEKIFFGKCSKMNCEKVKKTIIEINHDIEKMMIVNNTMIAVLHQHILTVFNEKGEIIDQVHFVDDLQTINSKFLYFSKDYVLYRWEMKSLYLPIVRDVQKFAIDSFGSKLIIFADCITPKESNEFLMMCNKNIESLAISKNGMILVKETNGEIKGENLAVTRKNEVNILMCRIHGNCTKLLELDTNYVSLVTPNSGGFVAISVSKEKGEINYYFSGRRNYEKVFHSVSKGNVSEVVLSKYEKNYPRIFMIENGNVVMKQCQSSKCEMGVSI
ncbi:hypothetical protein TRFO_25806 [Tritrichomonas foetus]|uniref:Uncharacterized protein n=1 Tax=Tritrichomonas foetus TaxID=1144522 RepID=A0A1J4K5C7_9EUKA|nr:hypothetical protein TRFO_25806 [Tritrichomonas foetus]|eukprot:OHT06194.1 hypothetical protein TRFO_25806 [Tritrichomonas foetus]